MTDNLKNLMSNILKTKRITNYYIIYNLSLMAITCVIYIVAAILYDPVINKIETIQNKFATYLGFGLGLLISFSILIGLYYLLYNLLYGRLIRKLNRNYEELKKLDL